MPANIGLDPAFWARITERLVNPPALGYPDVDGLRRDAQSLSYQGAQTGRWNNPRADDGARSGPVNSSVNPTGGVSFYTGALCCGDLYRARDTWSTVTAINAFYRDSSQLGREPVRFAFCAACLDDEKLTGVKELEIETFSGNGTAFHRGAETGLVLRTRTGHDHGCGRIPLRLAIGIAPVPGHETR